MANKNKQQEFYTSPEVKVIEIKARQVICGSTTGMPVDDPFNF